MKRVFGVFVVAVGLALFLSTAQADGTASQPFDRNTPGGMTAAGADVLVIETGLPVGGTIVRALNELGVPHDLFVGDDFSAVPLAQYRHVFLGLDGGTMGNASIQHVAEWARLGGCAHFYGGSCWEEYAIALNVYFLQNNTVDYCWATVSGSPDATIVDAGHYLASGLPATYNFLDDGATFYQTRSTDGSVSVAAINGDKYQMLMSKPFLAGNFDICINSPADLYYSNDSDYQWLKRVVANMLTCGAATPIEAATWGTIKASYR